LHALRIGNLAQIFHTYLLQRLGKLINAAPKLEVFLEQYALIQPKEDFEADAVSIRYWQTAAESV